ISRLKMLAMGRPRRPRIHLDMVAVAPFRSISRLSISSRAFFNVAKNSLLMTRIRFVTEYSLFS
ncbi:MAG TPA: hypothetical protein VHV83_05900, partial [Armatimonadota bacterium]|nr:hypothetical protein [Armatimonadota bacterium]